MGDLWGTFGGHLRHFGGPMGTSETFWLTYGAPLVGGHLRNFGGHLRDFGGPMGDQWSTLDEHLRHIGGPMGRQFRVTFESLSGTYGAALGRH